MAWLGSFFGGTGGGSGGNEFVGQLVELGKQKLRIKKVIAEGGYGFVFVAQDATTSKEYALKRLMAADDATSKLIVKEVSFLRKLRGHPNIVQYIGAASGEEARGHGMKEYLILTELCSGQLIDLIKSSGGRPLPFEQVLKIYAQVCRAVIHMHKQTPPIIHRDLKIENMLFSCKGVIKLCDFGSATSDALYPDDSWTALQRNIAEDEIQRNTTPMYRSPEMIDLYSNFAVTTKADVWALGCILYLLCFSTHPFEDSAKLKIMNANYTIPENDTTFQELHHLIRCMLKVVPDERSNVEDIYAELVSIAADRSIDLKGPIVESSGSAVVVESELTPGVGSNYGSSILLGNVVNKAGALFSNIKDVSSKVMNTMAGYAKSDMDISYITSRLLVMSFPADGIEGTYKNNIDDVRLFMDTKHPEGYVVINISQRTYRTAKLNDRVYDCGWNPKRTPSLEKLVSLCRKLNNFLKQNKKNVVVIHCLDGRVASSLLLCSFFLFCKLFPKLPMALQLFNMKRCSLEEHIVLSPSQKRYCNYVGQMVSSTRVLPHDNIVFLKSFSISPIPIFNKARTGCRPFIEIYESEKRILNTAQEIDQMREYHTEDGKIVFQTHIRLHGDITILVHHGRSTLGGKVQGKLTSINIFTLQFHTGFLNKKSNVVNFPMSELDIQEPGDKYPSNFGVFLNIKFTDETPKKDSTMPWEKMHVEKLSPYVCFSSREEYWILHEEYGLSEEGAPISNEKVTSTLSDPEYTPMQKREDPSSEKESLLFHLDSNDVSKNGVAVPATSSASLLFDNTEHDTLPAVSATIPQNNILPLSTPQYDIPVNSNAENDRLTADLIDISTTPDQSTNVDNNLIGNDFAAFSESPFSENDDSKQNNASVLIDPFESLATIRTNNNDQLNNKLNNDCLVNLDLPLNATVTKSTSFTSGFDLINSVNQSTASGKQFSPDILPGKQFSPDILPQESSTLKKNRSCDDLTIESIFGKPEGTSIAISINKPTSSIDPFMKHFHNSPRKSISESNLLGEWGEGLTTETLTPEIHHASSSNSLNKNNSYDPLSEFGNLQNHDTFGTKEFTKPVTPTFQSSPTMSSASTFSQPKSSPNYNVFISPSDTGVFTGKAANASKPPSGWAPKPVNDDEFSDILGAQGFVKTSFGEPPKNSLKQLRDIHDDQIDIDPVKKKIREWSDGKGRNIRALLTSLQTVLWESENKWNPIGIHQLMHGNQVKAFYRKACLAIHPDKHAGEPHEDLARAIFIELNEAWSLFEDSGSLSLV